MPSQPVVLYAANGDSIASANSFTDLIENAPSLVDSDTDTSGMSVTFAEGGGLRAMPLSRAIQDYLPDSDRNELVARLKQRAQANTKLAKWLETHPDVGPAGPGGPTGPTGTTGVAGFVATEAGKAAGL